MARTHLCVIQCNDRTAVGGFVAVWLRGLSPSRLVWIVLVGCAAGAGFGANGGCRGMPKSTRLTVDDFQMMAGAIAADLQKQLAVGLLADRTPQSDRWIIAIRKVRNRTDDLISDGEKWYLMAKARDSLSKSFLVSKNIAFVIPAEQWRRAAAVGDIERDSFQGRAPTHTMTGSLRSARRATRDARTDGYLFDCEITCLADGEIVWSGQVLFKRAAKGRLWD